MSRFADYATSTAFHLTLSKPQIRCMCQIDQTGSCYLLLGTFRALEDKGLVERVKGGGLALTEAGKAVMPLLRLAGLYVEGAWEREAA